MKKIKLIAFCLTVAFSSIFFIGCGNSDNNGAPENPYAELIVILVELQRDSDLDNDTVDSDYILITGPCRWFENDSIPYERTEQKIRLREIVITQNAILFHSTTTYLFLFSEISVIKDKNNIIIWSK